MRILDAARGPNKDSVFTLIEVDGDLFIHYIVIDGYKVFAVEADDERSMQVNNALADWLERESG
jgi:hypothetical protein